MSRVAKPLLVVVRRIYCVIKASTLETELWASTFVAWKTSSPEQTVRADGRQWKETLSFLWWGAPCLWYESGRVFMGPFMSMGHNLSATRVVMCCGILPTLSRNRLCVTYMNARKASGPHRRQAIWLWRVAKPSLSEYLLGHQKIHNGEGHFMCDVCCNAFVYKKDSLCHQKIHSGENVMCVCVVGKKFTLVPSLSVLFSLQFLD